MTSLMNGVHLSDSETSEDEYETEIMYDRSSRRIRHKITRVDDDDLYAENTPDWQPLMDKDGEPLILSVLMPR